ncbi:hypothetical protein [Alishewanella phage vB_AspM_Slicko01]|nr:hypothetical protein [Alishewanella phage vB_AspM_Slicko01]
MKLPQIIITTCVTIDGYYCYNGKNIVDHPFVTDKTRLLDRAILRMTLSQNRNGALVAGQQVIEDLGNLPDNFHMTTVTTNLVDDAVDRAFVIASLSPSNILVMGGRTTYSQFIKANRGNITLIRHVLDFSLGDDCEGSKKFPFDDLKFRDATELSFTQFNNSFLVTESY